MGRCNNRHFIKPFKFCTSHLAACRAKLLPGRKQIFERNDILIAVEQLGFSHNSYTTPRPFFNSGCCLLKLKSAYLLWFGHYQVLPKTHRFSLGARIDLLLIETIEAVAAASFLRRDEKQPYVRLAIRKLDTLKVLLLVLWETKSLDTKKYAALSTPLDEIGKMLGGWSGQLTKQNSPEKNQGEK
jgi:hypothetical protein